MVIPDWNELKKPVDQMSDTKINALTDSLIRKIVKIDKDETESVLGPNVEPLEYIVQKDDTLKSISEKFAISFVQLSISLLDKTKTTSIFVGQKIEIPRYLIDLTKAV
jgi:LysM repeat protein